MADAASNAIGCFESLVAVVAACTVAGSATSKSFVLLGGRSEAYNADELEIMIDDCRGSLRGLDLIQSDINKTMDVLNQMQKRRRGGNVEDEKGEKDKQKPRHPTMRGDILQAARRQPGLGDVKPRDGEPQAKGSICRIIRSLEPGLIDLKPSDGKPKAQGSLCTRSSKSATAS